MRQASRVEERSCRSLERSVVHEQDTIFAIHDDDDGLYVELTFNEVIRLLSMKDRNTTAFSKRACNRSKVNVFKFVDDILAYMPSEE